MRRESGLAGDSESSIGAALLGGPAIEQGDVTGLAVPSGRDQRAGRPSWLAPVALVVLALVVRTAVVVADTGYQPKHDAWDYDRHARSIAAGDGYPESYDARDGGPTALRAPGYPYFLGAVYALSGDSITAGRLANVALGGLAVLFLYLIAKRIWGQRVGLLAAGLAALFPPLVLISRELLSEPLFIVLELGAVLCVLAFRRSGGALRWAMVAGILCGLATLTRDPGSVLIIPIALGVCTIRPRVRLRSIAAPLTVILCAALTTLPWTVRNAIEFGRFVPVTTGAGFALAGTYNEVSLRDTVHPGAWRTPVIVPEYAALFRAFGIDEGTQDATLLREATSFAWHHPGYVAETTGWNLLRLFELSGASVVGLHDLPVNTRGIGSADPTVERVGLAITIPLALLGIVAIVRSRFRIGLNRRHPIPRGPWFLWLIPILLLLSAAPVSGLPRYRLPADPFMLILSAIGLLWLWGWIDERRLKTA